MSKFFSDLTKRFASIRSQMLIGIFASAALPLILTFYLNHTVTHEALMKQALERGSETARSALRQVELIMDHTDLAISGLVIDIENHLIDVQRETSTQTHMVELQELLPQISDITLLSLDADVIHSTTFTHTEFTDRSSWFAKAKSGTTVWSSPHKVLQDEKLYITAYYPIKDSNSEVHYVLTARISLELLAEHLSTLRFGSSGYFMLFDNNQNLIYHPDRKRTLSKLDPQATLAFHYPPQDHLQTMDNGQHYLLVQQKVMPEINHTEQEWNLMGLAPCSEILTPLVKLRSQQGLIAIITLGFLGAFGLFASRKLTRPVITAGRLAQRVAQGDMSFRAPVEGPLELQWMSQAFNHMVSEMGSLNERLEYLVDERTASLGAVLNALDDGLLLIGTDKQKIVDANIRFFELFNLSVEEVIDQPADEVLERFITMLDQENQFRKEWENCKKDPFWSFKKEWECNGKFLRHLSTFSAPVVNSTGETIARIWLFEDISAQRQLQAELHHSMKMEAVGRLAGGVAHDFNNVLTVILGYTQMLLDEAHLQPHHADDLQQILHSSQRASELTEQLLAIGHQENMQGQYVSLNEVLTEMHGLLQRSLGSHIVLELNTPKELPSLYIEPGQLHQIILNLSINARDAMPTGGRLTISTSLVELDSAFCEATPNKIEAGQYVCLEVKDTGQGMDIEIQKQVFEPFFTTKGEQGTGLGLTSVSGIIQRHHGHISISSDLDKGTTFHLFFRAKGNVPQEEQMDSSVAVEIVMQCAKILVIDDDPALLMVTSRMLTKIGFEVLEAGNAETALERLRQEQPIPIVLTDIIMPGCNGIELARDILQEFPETHILFMSGYNNTTISDDIARIEQYTFIQKPFNLDSLKKALDKALNDKQESSLSLDAPKER